MDTRLKEQHKRIVKKSISLLTPTTKKANISIMNGGIVCAVGVVTYAISKPVAVGLLIAGIVQVGVGMTIRKSLEK